ncbi:MAG TPA: amidohydrolase family protein, partial [Roseimicrobium sp.]|nr:amidohydrolase family protein [Roseimicrobium sp.]
LLATTCIQAAPLLPPGYRPLPAGIHALTKARLIIKPGQVIESGTVVIRDGRIEAAGAGVVIPADARVWDLTGQTVYPGFVDPYFSLNATNPPVSTSRSEPIGAMSGAQFFGVPGSSGPGNTISPRIAPEQRASQKPGPSSKTAEELRELGFTAINVVPSSGILRGTSALMSLGEGEPGMATLKPDVFQHVAFELPTSENQGYPESLMGVIAAVRQTFFDAQHYKLDLADYAKRPTARNRPAYSPALESLQPSLDGKQKVVFEPGSVLMQDRAMRMAKELGVQPVLVASGQEWRRPDMLPALDATFIVPLNFPALPKLPTDEDWNAISLDQLRNWDWAPENVAVLKRAKKEVALTLYGLGEKKSFRKQLQLALDRGLTEDEALAALTTIPARLCGVENVIGTVEAGKLANLLIVEGSYFDPKSKVQSVWIDGRHFPIEPDTKTFQLTVSTNKPAAKDDKEAKAKESRETQRKRIARETLSDRGPLNQPAAVLITNATVWTSAKAGILANASVLVRNGKIVRVGKFSETATDRLLVIDGTGLHVTAGLIDCHSHTAIVGDVNEGTLPSTAMVRIGDVVNSETENLYQQLAGGLTAANLLHGSANPIGGQNCVI